ncbi:hypothetical protein EHM94_16020 [Marinobacter sp. NP-6]|nr:hypothetical protein EHM94_16020 [Marinobacter sp. NP-6]
MLRRRRIRFRSGLPNGSSVGLCLRGSLLRTGGLGWSAGVYIFSLGKKNSLRSDTFFLAGKNIDPHAH